MTDERHDDRDDDRDDDDLDAQLRGAMAALDRATPAARFDDLIERAMARVEDPTIGELPALRVADDDGARDAERDDSGRDDSGRDDSGLKDIRALATETKARLASRRSSQDLAAAASSASWKAVAMPEPAHAQVPAPAPRRRRWLAGGLGVGLAAAAGLVIFVSTQKPASQEAAAVKSPVKHDDSAPSDFVPEPMSVPRPAAVPPSPAPAQVATHDAGGRLAVSPKPTSASPRPLSKAPAKGKKAGAYIDTETDLPPSLDAAPSPSPSPNAPGPGRTAGSGSADPVEAAVQAKPIPTPTKLARTSLSTDDIKRGMTAVEPRARACFAGTAGLASVRLAVAPSGQVTAVTVTGAFAGTPVGGCVERAVRAAAFPAWDGAPQSFNYSYLLSD